MVIFIFFEMAAAAILDFRNLKFLTVETVKKVELHQKSLQPWPRKCLFTPLLGFFGGTFPPNDVTHRPNPKKDRPWAEPRHLSQHVSLWNLRISCDV